MALTRRAALGLTAGLGLAGAGAILSLPRNWRAPFARVAIIGAGLAGLQAAQTLQQAGCQVTVIEARERIGGRIHTSHAWPDFPVDLGASWVHGDADNPLMTLARATKAKLHPTSYDRSQVLIGRSLRADGIVRIDDAAVAKVRRAAEQLAERSPRDMSIAEAVERLKLSPKLAPQVAFDLESNFVLEYGAPPERISAWYGDAKGWPGRDVLFPGGFYQLVRELARGLDIRLGCEVTALQQDQTGITVTDRQGRLGRFDAAIVAVPLALLQAERIAFSPTLPQAKQDAISRLGMGLLDKLWLRFDRIHWPSGPDWFEHAAKPAHDWAQWVSLAPYRRSPVLLGLVGGGRAKALEAMPQAAVIESALAALRDMFGSRFPAPVAAQWTRWHADPFSLGGYSFAALGSTPADRIALAKRYDRIGFAGEAAHKDQWGTAHGALLSGQSAAMDLLGLWKDKSA